LPYHTVRRLGDQTQRSALNTRTSEVLDRPDGAALAVFHDDFSMRALLRLRPELDLRPLVADGE